MRVLTRDCVLKNIFKKNKKSTLKQRQLYSYKIWLCFARECDRRGVETIRVRRARTWRWRRCSNERKEEDKNRHPRIFIYYSSSVFFSKFFYADTYASFTLGVGWSYEKHKCTVKGIIVVQSLNWSLPATRVDVSRCLPRVLCLQIQILQFLLFQIQFAGQQKIGLMSRAAATRTLAFAHVHPKPYCASACCMHANTFN